MTNLDKASRFLLDNLKNLIGKEVKVYIDKQLDNTHSKQNDIVYPLNYGYIKEYVSSNRKYLDAYVLGINKVEDEFCGKVIAVINRTNDDKDKLVVVNKNSNFSISDIEKAISLQEKNIRTK